MFELDAFYTRTEIHEQCGGSVQSYLPELHGRITCACLKKKTNPDAPLVILPGTGDKIESAAELLVAQKDPIPVFLKKAVNQWQYVGMYKAIAASQDAAEIEEHARRSGRDRSAVPSDKISMVIHMAPAEVISDISPEYDCPPRCSATVHRVLRCSAIVSELKELYGNECQICRTRLNLKTGADPAYYCEAHHLKPLGTPHNGADVKENIVIVCPNHHVLLDYGALKVCVEDLQWNRHHIGEEFIKYHNHVRCAGVETP